MVQNKIKCLEEEEPDVPKRAVLSSVTLSLEHLKTKSQGRRGARTEVSSVGGLEGDKERTLELGRELGH